MEPIPWNMGELLSTPLKNRPLGQGSEANENSSAPDNPEHIKTAQCIKGLDSLYRLTFISWCH
jgi:hypothetical protein